MAKILIKWFQVVVAISALILAMNSWSEEAADTGEIQRPGYLASMADALLVRPITFAATIVGSALFVVTSPVTALTGTIGEAGQTLVVDPALTTFYRCLGCTEVGWRKLPKKDAAETP